jgi:hypothetical protein
MLALVRWLSRGSAVAILLCVTGASAPLHAADAASAPANSAPAQHVIYITIDGMRYQELFSGADAKLMQSDTGGVYNPEALRARFAGDDPIKRRERLMPFFWSVIAEQGQVFGSPDDNCEAIVKNGKYFSYPGYQELLCGFPDDAIDSNDKKPNANKSVLEWLNEKPELKGKVAAFTSWDLFPYILHAGRSGIFVNSGWQQFDFIEDEAARSQLNRTMRELPHLWEYARFDYFTIAGALEYLSAKEPSVLYISLDETDDWCHAGRYDLYLDAANRTDGFIKTLWEFVQSSPTYQGTTSLVITTDHGRGDGREGWKNHGVDLPGSHLVWSAVMGPEVPALGVRKDLTVTQGQGAATVALLLGYDYAASDPRIAPPLPGILSTTDDATESPIPE